MKILLATDGSAHAQLAETLLTKLPGLKQARVRVATAVSPPAITGMGAFQPLGAYEAASQANLAYEQSRQVASSTCSRAAERLQQAGMDSEAVLLEGEPGNALLELAEQEQFDLIAIGSRGLGGLRSFILGSVARKLVNHARSSVLVARAYEDEGPEQSIDRLGSKEKLATILAYDGSLGAAHARDWLIAQGQRAFDKVIVVVAEPLSATPFGVDPSAFREAYSHDHEQAAAIAREGAGSLAESADEIIGETVVGRPVDMLVQQATARQADLVVIGATRHGALERFFLGSVSYEVATSAPCSVVVVRPPATEDAAP